MSIAESIRKIPIFKRSERPSSSSGRMPIADYDNQAAGDITSQLPGLSQRELIVVEAYERKHAKRDEVTDRVVQLIGDEPWEGYDDASSETIIAALNERDLPVARRVKIYETAHKGRGEVLGQVTERIARV